MTLIHTCTALDDGSRHLPLPYIPTQYGVTWLGYIRICIYINPLRLLAEWMEASGSAGSQLPSLGSDQLLRLVASLYIFQAFNFSGCYGYLRHCGYLYPNFKAPMRYPLPSHVHSSPLHN
jgi:hypothetical protein